MIAPWWTDADAAELDAIVYELVRVVFDHREACAICKAGEDECGRLREGLRDALEAVTDWRYARMLRSKAEWLRGREAA